MDGLWETTAQWLLARIGDLPVPDLGNLSATAILGWYVWHTARRTIPGLVREFRAELAAARDQCQAERELFRAEMALERDQRQTDHGAIIAALRDLAGQLPPNQGQGGPYHV